MEESEIPDHRKQRLYGSIQMPFAEEWIITPHITKIRS